MWETVASTADCGTTPLVDDAADDAVLTEAMLQMGQEELRQMSLLSGSEIMSNEEVANKLRVWIRNELPEKNATVPSDDDGPPTNALTLEMARDVIAQVLETERADQLGMVDYASILAGASVIQRATSPSLVDSLPLLNRLMEQARLRFYGYGPEAALTPTFPVHALGQCWAFERDAKGTGKSGARYATLTVQLVKPIYVTRVVVEHAPKELTDQPETAIQRFRILGYKDKDASDEPWHLGSFQYDIGKPHLEYHLASF